MSRTAARTPAMATPRNCAAPLRMIDIVRHAEPSAGLEGDEPVEGASETADDRDSVVRGQSECAEHLGEDLHRHSEGGMGLLVVVQRGNGKHGGVERGMPEGEGRVGVSDGPESINVFSVSRRVGDRRCEAAGGLERHGATEPPQAIHMAVQRRRSHPKSGRHFGHGSRRAGPLRQPPERPPRSPGPGQRHACGPRTWLLSTADSSAGLFTASLIATRPGGQPWATVSYRSAVFAGAGVA